MSLKSPRLRRGLLLAAAALVLLVAAVAVLNRLGGDDAFGALHGGGVWAYVTIFAMVFGDAVCPILPGETTLNAASTLAAAGSLDLTLVIAAGAVGAIVGDSTLFPLASIVISGVVTTAAVAIVVLRMRAVRRRSGGSSPGSPDPEPGAGATG